MSWHNLGLGRGYSHSRVRDSVSRFRQTDSQIHNHSRLSLQSRLSHDSNPVFPRTRPSLLWTLWSCEQHLLFLAPHRSVKPPASTAWKPVWFVTSSTHKYIYPLWQSTAVLRIVAFRNPSTCAALIYSYNIRTWGCSTVLFFYYFKQSLFWFDYPYLIAVDLY